jgi:hypothetical protein
MKPQRVFLSAVTSEVGEDFLKSAAETIHNTLQCVCRYRNNLILGTGSLPEKLRQEIEESDCVIHLVGKRFGHGPEDMPQPGCDGVYLWKDDCRTWWPFKNLPSKRSYTQMEFDFAKSLKKPTYVFLFSSTAENGGATPETYSDDDLLQQQHQLAVTTSQHDYVMVESLVTLQQFLNKLPIAVSALKSMIVEREAALNAAEQAAKRGTETLIRLMTTLNKQNRKAFVVSLVTLAFFIVVVKFLDGPFGNSVHANPLGGGGRGDMIQESGASIRECFTNAVGYWEPRRLVFNLLAAACAIAAHGMKGWWTFKLFRWIYAFWAFGLCFAMNCLYSTAYVPDMIMQLSDYRAVWIKWRFLLYGAGILLAMPYATAMWTNVVQYAINYAKKDNAWRGQERLI